MQKRVVIIGGGFAGSNIAKALENNFDVTLIDNKDYFEFTPSVLRTIVEPEHIKKIQALHNNYLNRAAVVKGNVKEISNKNVTVSGHKFPYGYLVISSGSEYGIPMKGKDIVIAARAKELGKYSEKLRKADNVLIVGGGLVGVELAAEIVEKYPEKKVVIVEGSKELIGRNPEKARKYAKRFLEKRNVKMIFNELVAKSKGNMYKTNKGTEIKADLAFSCTGIKPNSLFLRKNLSKSLDERGFVIVNRHMQVNKFSNVFAAGDITNIKEEKLAQNSEYHANTVSYNINALERGREMREYEPKHRIMVISLGKWNGILVYRNFVLTGLIPSILKGMIEWKEMAVYKRKIKLRSANYFLIFNK